ncbi:serine O-acetyltransferase [Chloroherpeton thalassium ATCC 35110]|uniref:Serine acetyltransferase n=1 Tax=Chloroherpeton thalassium (strain ATCC 35110 / GB-78) TaxID=517418 RepID=B3QY94_CHLT3|nr:serine O-acetyltransferase [Chloroherpeton thalassium]ACF15060.1 serine O-acetyltransferase [Chloroherpeton thalassium ATCC 35110]
MATAASTPIWDIIRREVEEEVKNEPLLAKFLEEAVLKHASLVDALRFHLAQKLSCQILSAAHFESIVTEAYSQIGEIECIIRSDIEAIVERDPATVYYYEPLLFFKGFHALEAYRVAHWLWLAGRKSIAYFLQNRISEAFAVDIHPAATIGKGVFIDHATGVVIGETAVIEDNVSLLHSVTLGGTGKETGDRHPKVRHGVLIGAGAKILGNVEIGAGAKIGAGSVVLENIPPHTTAAGVPARVLGKVEVPEPALEMNHRLTESECPEKKRLRKKRAS